MSRTIRCTIEMELQEFEHFNGLEQNLSDEEALKEAEFRFIEIINEYADKDVIQEYLQSKIVEEAT